MSRLLFSFLITVATSVVVAAPSRVLDESRPHPSGWTAAAATAHPLATAAALEMLERGGNAVDAAVAAALTLPVVEPHASGLGGGGLMVISLDGGREVEVINYREVAPAAADATLYMNASGEVERSRARRGPLAVAVPGHPAGLGTALARHGTMDWDEVIQPAIRHADGGITITEKVAGILFDRTEIILNDPGLTAVLAPDLLPPEAGDTLFQPLLAQTLRRLAEEGPEWFYTGPVGEELVRVVQERGGVITAEDLLAYEPVIGEPLSFTYRDHRVVTLALPSAGALSMARALRALEEHDLAALDPRSAEFVDIVARALREAMRVVRPRAGDPLTIAGEVDLDRLTDPSVTFESPVGVAEGSASTTHLSVIDADGNAVALTQTINYWLGSGILLPESGVMLNNEMSDFFYPGDDLWVEGGANHLTPHARPATSMGPMIVHDPSGEIIAVLGTPGGMRIPSALVQILVNLIDRGMDIESALSAPRFHPPSPSGPRLDIETGFGSEVIEQLTEMGWEIRAREWPDPYFGGAQALVRDPQTGLISGAADPRRDGNAGGL